MKTRWCCAALVPLFVAAFIVCVGGPAALAGDSNALAFSGPYTHKNLTIYLIHAPDKIKIKEFLTLQEALDRQKAVLSETGSVNQLTVESLCDIPIYIHAGAIIKGGKQDRVIKDDCILPPKAKITLQVFCVEQGRWRGRGAEPVDKFSGNDRSISSTEMKLAVRSAGKQQEVWTSVANAQKQLGDKVGGDVRSKESESSLQLTLEDKKVQQAVSEYDKALADILKDGKDAVGYAFVINGKILSVDVYGSHNLFAKLWPQLLGSTATEAVAKLDKDKTFKVPGKEAVQAFIDESRKAKAEERAVAEKSYLIRREDADSANFTTMDKSQPSAGPVRENIINKK